VRRIVWDPDHTAADIGDAPEEAVWMRKMLKLGELEVYVRTYSASGAWRDSYPEKKRTAEGGPGYIVNMMFDAIRDTAPVWKARGKLWQDVKVDVVWGTVILLARRR
jgi:hypothetical protein